MAITFPITGVTNNGTSRSPSFTLGTAPAAGDVITVFVSSVNIFAITDVAGWPNAVAANTVIASDAHAACMFTHEVTSGEAGAATVTWTLTNLLNAGDSWRITATVSRADSGVLAVTGSAGTGFNSANTATPFVIPSVTPGHNNAQVIGGLVADSATITQTTPAGFTLRANGGSNYLYSRDALGSAGVPTGTTNVTPSTGDEYIGIAIALREVVAVVVWAPPCRPAQPHPQPWVVGHRRIDPPFDAAAPTVVAPYVTARVTPRPLTIVAARVRRQRIPFPATAQHNALVPVRRRARPPATRQLVAHRADPPFVVAAPVVVAPFVPTVARHTTQPPAAARARRLQVPFPATAQHNALVVPARVVRPGPRARPLLAHRLDPPFVVAVAPPAVAPFVARTVTPRPLRLVAAQVRRQPVRYHPSAVVPSRTTQRAVQRPTVARPCRQTVRTGAPYVPAIWPARTPTTTRPRVRVLPSRRPHRQFAIVGAGAVPVISGPYHPVRMAWREPAAAEYQEPDAMSWHEPGAASYREPPAMSWHEPDGEP